MIRNFPFTGDGSDDNASPGRGSAGNDPPLPGGNNRLAAGSDTKDSMSGEELIVNLPPPGGDITSSCDNVNTDTNADVDVNIDVKIVMGPSPPVA